MSTTTEVPTTLRADGLSREQQLHFAEHGWVLLERVIEPELCQKCCAATENMLARVTCGTVVDPTDNGHSKGLRDAHHVEQVFFELYKIPGLLTAARQLIGHEKVRCVQSFTAITEPHRERHSRPEVVSNQRAWVWHRNFQPRDIVLRDQHDPELINSAMITIGMYFVPIAPEHGVTALYDTSHTYEGHWAESHEIYDEFKDRLDVVQPTAEAGSIVIFSEATLHTPVPVISEQRRFAHFAFLAVPWFSRHGQEPHLRAYFADDDLRHLFSPCLTYDPAHEPDIK